MQGCETETGRWVGSLDGLLKSGSVETCAAGVSRAGRGFTIPVKECVRMCVFVDVSKSDGFEGFSAVVQQIQSRLVC